MTTYLRMYNACPNGLFICHPRTPNFRAQFLQQAFLLSRAQWGSRLTRSCTPRLPAGIRISMTAVRDNCSQPKMTTAVILVLANMSSLMLLLCRELITQNSLCHPHIVHLKRVVLFKTHLGLVLEYMPGGNLDEYRNEYCRFVQSCCNFLLRPLHNPTLVYGGSSTL